MKKKGWILVTCVILILCVVLFGIRHGLMVRMFPKLVLSGAIEKSFEQLDQRFTASPVHLLSDVMDDDGCQKASLKLQTSDSFLGPAYYSLDVNTQRGPNRVTALGSVMTQSGEMDLGLYLDEQVAALSSQALTDGNYYAITYDTFASDIRGFELLSFLAGEEVLDEWEDSLRGIQKWMKMDISIPKFSSEDIKTALMGALVLKPQVERGVEKGAYKISFGASGPEIAEFARPYASQLPEDLADLLIRLETDENSAVSIAFRMQKGDLRALEGRLSFAEDYYQIQVQSGENLMESPLMLTVVSYEDKSLTRQEINLYTVCDEKIYREKTEWRTTKDGIQTAGSAAYSWDLISGDMDLTLVRDGKKHEIFLNLTGEGDTVTVYFPEFQTVQSVLDGKVHSGPATCTLVVSPGNPVETLDSYKNIGDWSGEDLLFLLTRMGKLLGLPLP